MRRPALPLAFVSLALHGPGCGVGAEAAFINGARLDICESELPICNTTAGCKLVEEDAYIEGVFPGQRQLIVPTEGEAYIRVRIFWMTQVSPGADTEIIWHEPACVDRVAWESEGADIFVDTGNDNVFQQDGHVYRGGEHLIEIRSDATSEFLLKTEVLTPAEYEQEQAELRGITFPGAE